MAEPGARMDDADRGAALPSHDVAVEQVRGAAAAALSAARRLVDEGRSPWAGSLLGAAERLEFDVRWYELDLDRRNADAAALRNERHGTAM